MLFFINNLPEPSKVSLQPVSGSEPCHVTPHGKTTSIINNEGKLGAGSHRIQISDSEAFIQSGEK